MTRPAQPRGEAPDPTARRRILLIDDNDDARIMMGLLLELKGHAVAMADGGIAGLACARQFRPECIFLDLGMPGMDGYDTVIALRRIAGLEQVPVVALSGWNDKTTLARVRSAGFDHHLTKPADIEEIDRILCGDLAFRAKPPLQQASRHL